MKVDVFKERLNWFKEHEKPEVVLMVANNETRIWLVVAWMSTNVSRQKKLTHLKSESENEIWNWLWENTRFSLDEVKVKSAVSTNEIGTGMDLLIANRIIYPDGTVNSFVQRYLREKVFKLFVERPKRAIGKSKF
ncbi:MAG: hypothetical protein AB1546_01470 [bacterium]